MFALIFAVFLLFSSLLDRSQANSSWESNCRRVECQNAFIYCNLMKKLGLNECKQCVTLYSPYCAQCARDVFETNVYMLTDAGTNENFCKSSERMHQEGCKLICRANDRTVGQCMENAGEPLCQCSPEPYELLHTARQ
jgi:hypothetical protein